MDKKIKIFATVVFICVVICLISVSILTCTLPDTPTPVPKGQICLPNEPGSLNCGKTTVLLHDYLESIIENQYDKVKEVDEEQQKYLNKNRVKLTEELNKDFWEIKPAAKLTGRKHPPLRKIDYGTDMVAIREWHHGKQLCSTNGFVRYGIRYRNGRLVVPVDGTYFVYSNLDFFEDCNPPSGIPNVRDINKPIKHGIFKFNIFQSKEIELVSYVQPHMISSNRFYNSYSSYVSSLAELKAGDEITVKVSNITYLRYTRDNYFGMNLI